MKDPILLNKLWKEVEAGRVTASRSGFLTLFKYTQGTHINDEWNDVNRQARGIIFHTDGTVVARPFEKFFNLNERPDTHADALPWKNGVEVFEKLDGSCGIGYQATEPIWNEVRWKLATPGSMESDQAIAGTEMLQQYNWRHLPDGCTPVFEIVYPENRIVVDYRGESFLALLAIFDHNGTEWHQRRVDQVAEVCNFRRPQRYDINIAGEIEWEENTEGYVARFGCGLRVKVKSPTYLRIHRLLNYLSPKGVVDLIRGREYGVTVKQLPPAIARDFDDVRAHVQGIHNRIFTDAHASRNRMLSEIGENQSRKTYALWVQDNVPNRECGLVFALLDEKEIEEKVWKLVLEEVKEAA